MITASDARTYFQLNDDGSLMWTRAGSARRAGKQAGRLMSNGYRTVCIKRRVYMEHRLVWLMTHGEWPSGVIDHIDGNKQNNRPSNLRDVTQSVNLQNRHKPQSNNQSKLLGVKSKPNGTYYSMIGVNRKYTYLGVFATAEEAHAAYIAAKAAMHPGYVNQPVSQ